MANRGKRATAVPVRGRPPTPLEERVDYHLFGCRVPRPIWEDFKKVCDARGRVYSRRVVALMERDVAEFKRLAEVAAEPR